MPAASRANVEALRAMRKGRFPHMGPVDSMVWQSVLETGAVTGDRFQYDVLLGGCGINQVPDNHELHAMWATLLCKRIDVVAWTQGAPTIIEVKLVAGFSALGQVLGYLDLWERERRSVISPNGVCCCAQVDEDLRTTFAKFGVALVELPLDRAAEILARLDLSDEAPATS